MATKTIEKDLIALEKRFWQAIKDGDVDAAVDLADEDCIVAGPQGVERIDKATFAAMMKNAPGKLLDFEIDDDIQAPAQQGRRSTRVHRARATNG